MDKTIYFKSPGCSVCVELLPKMESHFKERYPLLEFEVVDVSISPETAALHSVFTAPTLIVLFEDKEFHRFVRNFSPSQVDSQLQRVYQLRFE